MSLYPIGTGSLIWLRNDNNLNPVLNNVPVDADQLPIRIDRQVHPLINIEDQFGRLIEGITFKACKV